METRFSACPDRTLDPPSLLYNGYQVFTGGRRGRGGRAYPPPHLESRGPKKSRAIPLLTLRDFVVYKRVKIFLYLIQYEARIFKTLVRHGLEYRSKTHTLMQIDELQLCNSGRKVLHKICCPVHETEEQGIIKNCTSFIVHRISQERLQLQGCDGEGSYK